MSTDYHNEVLGFVSATIDNITNALAKEPYLKDDTEVHKTKINQMRQRLNAWTYIRSQLVRVETDTKLSDLEKMTMAMTDLQMENVRLARKIVTLQNDILKLGKNDGKEKDPSEISELL